MFTYGAELSNMMPWILLYFKVINSNTMKRLDITTKKCSPNKIMSFNKCQHITHL